MRGVLCLVSVAEFITVRFQHRLNVNSVTQSVVSVAEFITVRFQPVRPPSLSCHPFVSVAEFITVRFQLGARPWTNATSKFQ